MPRTDETGRLAPNAARLRKIKDVISTTKTFRQRETDRIYSFCYCQSVLLSLFTVDKHQMRQGNERSKMRHPLQKHLEREREREYVIFFCDCQSVLRLRFFFLNF